MALSPKLFRRQVVDATRTGEPVTPRCQHAPPLGFCGGCTFQDRSYASQVAAKRAALIAQVTASRYMPPWKPQPNHGDFAGARSLTAAEIDAIRRWVAAGAPEDKKGRPVAHGLVI